MNLAPHIEAIARRLLGAPNRQHSTRQQLRFGSNGSVAVEIAGPKRGEWYDHEEQTGGGPLDLLYKKGGISNGAALEWLQSELGIEIESAGHPRKRIAATYDYRDETGALLYQAVRFEPKGFSQRRPDGNGGWIWKLDDARRILYRLPELIATPIETTIYIPEGERDVDQLREVGIPATYNSEGAGKWRPAFAEFFRHRDIVVLPDNDDAGRAHARTVAENLAPIARRVRIVVLPGLPPKGDVSDWLAAGSTRAELESLAAGTAPFSARAQDDEADGLRLLHFEAMRPTVDAGYLIKHLLGSTAMAVVYGEAGSGKSYLMIHAGLCLAAGSDFFGRRVRRVGVVYVAAEAGRGIANRIAAAKHEIEFPETMPFAAITSPLDLCSDTADLEKLIAAIRNADIGLPVELLVIDTLSRVMAGANENAPDDMGALVRNIDRIRADSGAAVVLVHHSGKDMARGARGHSLLRAACDTEIEVSRDDASKISTARVTKQRDYATDGSFSFTLRQIELGIDADGDAITACVVEEAEVQNKTAKSARLSPAQGRALQLLATAIDEAGEVPPASNYIPSGVRCVTENLWREYCYRGAISAGDQDAKRMAFKRAAEALVVAGRVGKWGEWVWLA